MRLITTALLGLALLVSACAQGPQEAPPSYDVSGHWTVTSRVTYASGVCASDIGSSKKFGLDVSQTGADLTLRAKSLTSALWTGTMAGDVVAFEGGHPEDGGYTTFVDSAVRIDSLTTFTGTVSWRWTGQGMSCTGTSSLYGTRPDAVRPLSPPVVAPPTVLEGGSQLGAMSCGAVVDCVGACHGDEDCMEHCADAAAPAAKPLLKTVEHCAEASGCEDFGCIQTVCVAQIAACRGQ